MNIDLKSIAESKVRQLVGDVCGVLVRKEDGTIMAVSEDGRCTRLDGGVMGAVDPAATIDKEDALDCALSGQSYTERLIQSACDELNAMAFDLRESHTVDGQWSASERDTAFKVDHLLRMAAELRKLDIVPQQAARAQGGQEVEPVAWASPLPDGTEQVTKELPERIYGVVPKDYQWYVRPLVYADTHRQPAQRGVPHWKQLEALADEYVEGYEFRGDEGDYQPNERERFLIEDCVAGLMDEVHQMLKRTKPQPAQQGSVPEGITVEMLDAIWQAGIDAENYDDRDFCDPLIRARIAIEESTTPQPQGDGWVKCSERLPRPRKNTRKAPNGILVKFNTGRVAQIHDVTETLVARMKGGPRHPAKFEATTPPRIVEWMDLDNPQPPKEGE